MPGIRTSLWIRDYCLDIAALMGTEWQRFIDFSILFSFKLVQQ